jgi:hypothetical protein
MVQDKSIDDTFKEKFNQIESYLKDTELGTEQRHRLELLKSNLGFYYDKYLRTIDYSKYVWGNLVLKTPI